MKTFSILFAVENPNPTTANIQQVLNYIQNRYGIDKFAPYMRTFSRGDLAFRKALQAKGYRVEAVPNRSGHHRETCSAVEKRDKICAWSFEDTNNVLLPRINLTVFLPAGDQLLTAENQTLYVQSQMLQIPIVTFMPNGQIYAI